MNRVPAGKPAACPSFAQTSRLVARSLGLSPQALSDSFRTATMSDLPKILALRARVLGPALDWDDQRYLTWRYHLGRQEQGGGECWVLMKEVKAGASQKEAGSEGTGTELLGMVGTQSLDLICAGHRLQANTLMDIMIQPELGSVGLGAWLNLAIQDRSEAALAIGSNRNSIGMIQRLFEPMPNRSTFAHPIRLHHVISKHLHIPGFTHGMAWTADHLFRIARTVWLAPSRYQVQVRPLDPLSPDLHDLNQRVAASDAHIHCERTSQALQWRLRDNPKGDFTLLGAWALGQLLAYVATRIKPLQGGRCALIVVDALMLPSKKGKTALRALLWNVFQQAWRQGADYVAATSYHREFDRELRHCGFQLQPHEFETMGWFCKDEKFRELMAVRPSWTLSELHTDRI